MATTARLPARDEIDFRSRVAEAGLRTSLNSQRRRSPDGLPMWVEDDLNPWWCVWFPKSGRQKAGSCPQVPLLMAAGCGEW